MGVTQLGIDLKSHDPVVILKDPQTGRSLAITIGPYEATAIALALEGTKLPRPLTHDLMKSLIEALKAKVDRVIIHKVEGDLFYAKVVLVESSGTTSEIDARPSDAIALALRTKSPIFVTESVLEYAPKERDKDTPRKSKNADASSLKTPRSRAQELVRQGDRLEAGAFTSGDGAFEPFRDPSGASHRGAILKYSAAIALCPTLAEAYAARCTAHYFLQETKAVQKDARVALQLGHLRDHQLLLLSAPFQGNEAREINRRCMKLAGPSSLLYDHIWADLARTYWYDGNFRSYVTELEALLAWQRLHRRKYTDVTLSSLGSGYEIMGNFEKAEKVFRQIGDGDALVRLCIHQGRWAEARACLERYAEKFEPDEKTVFSAGIDELDDKLDKVSVEQMAAAQRLGSDGSYYAFYLGLLELRDGKREQGLATLRAFCEMCNSNPKEWGVTLAWENKWAQHVLQSP